MGRLASSAAAAATKTSTGEDRGFTGSGVRVDSWEASASASSCSDFFLDSTSQ